MTQEEREKDEGSASNEIQNPYVIPASIVIAGVLIAGAVFYTNKSAPAPSKNAAAAVSPETRQDFPKNLADDDPFLGDPRSPVTIVEFGDFQCPFCGKFVQGAERDIIEQYVKTGKAKFVYRDFPLTAIHEEAQKSAEAAECADEQGQFWPYHDLLFARQGDLSVKNYKAWAVELGLKATQFNQCLDSGKYAPEIEKDAKDGLAAGVQGTPATFVNNRIVEGAVPFAQFAVIIEEELKKASR